MGRKLGNALIIYGCINLVLTFVLTPFVGVILFVSGIIWSVFLILLGRWARNKVSAPKTDGLSDAINRALDEREAKRGLR